MSWNLVYVLILTLAGFTASRLAFALINPETEQSDYSFRKDPFVALYLLMAAGIAAIYFFGPAFSDFIFPMTSLAVFLPLIFAALIYGIFLLEMDGLFNIAVIVSALAVAFLLPEKALVFEGLLPWGADHLLAAFILAVIALGAGVLNGLSGVFGLQCTAVALGISAVALIGGLPMVFGLWGAYLGGVWLGFINFNWYPEKIRLNRGACVSAAFLLGCTALRGAAEFSGPSMLILEMYFIAELIWIVTHRYVFNQRRPDWADNASYMSVFESGVTVPAINVAVAKIVAVNIILGCFQLFAPNAFSIPLFALLVNLWLINLLNNAAAGEENSLKAANRALVKNVKDGLKEIKESLKKDKS